MAERLRMALTERSDSLVMRLISESSTQKIKLLRQVEGLVDEGDHDNMHEAVHVLLMHRLYLKNLVEILRTEINAGKRCRYEDSE